MTNAEEEQNKKLLKKLGWKSNNRWEDDKWISPYTAIDYTFEQALKIEDLKTGEPR